MRELRGRLSSSVVYAETGGAKLCVARGCACRAYFDPGFAAGFVLPEEHFLPDRGIDGLHRRLSLCTAGEGARRSEVAALAGRAHDHYDKKAGLGLRSHLAVVVHHTH